MSVSIWTVIGQFFSLFFFALFIALIVGVPLLLYRIYRRQGQTVSTPRERDANQSADSKYGSSQSHQTE